MKSVSVFIAIILLAGTVFGTAGCGGPIYAIFAVIQEDDDDDQGSVELAIVTTSPPYAVNGVNYNQTIGVIGGSAPYSWSIWTNNPPSPLTLNPVTGILSGTPNDTPGDYTFTVEVMDSASPAATDREGVTVTLYDEMQITYAAPLPDAVNGAAYGPVTITASGGTGNLTWNITAGSLPSGLSLDTSSGEISGIPAGAEGSYSFTITVRDDASPPQTDMLDLTLDVYDAVVADFTATPTSGSEPLVVAFTDASVGGVTSWQWDFNNDSIVDSTARNPTHTYTTGIYTVRLSVLGPGDSHEETKTDFIVVDPSVVNTICVDGANGNDASNGLSWATAVKTIQRGIDIAGATGWTVVVADGTYTGTSNRDLDFAGKDMHLKSSGGPANCTIDGENYSTLGFYLHSGETQNAIVEGLTIRRCSAGFQCSTSSSPTIMNCIITNSNAGSGNGGIFSQDSSPTIINCAMVNNSGRYGGGISCDNSSPTIINCTIANNWAQSYGGGVYCTNNSNPTLSNTILWYNRSGTAGHQIYTSGSTVSMTYCDYRNGTGDISGIAVPTLCINRDPLFVSVGSVGYGGTGNYHLQAGSPCKDVGNNSFVTWSNDLDGRPRITDSDNDGSAFVDIGAYENRAYLFVPGTFATIQAAIDVAGDGDTILVADGTYTGLGNKDLDFRGKAICLKSENGATGCIIDCEFSGRGFYFHNSETNSATVEGFTIRNGDVVGAGGGIFCESSAPIIINCIVTNSLADYGGGIRCADSTDPTIINCTITGNTANEKAGGVSFYNCTNPSIVNCIVSVNSAATGAGGIGCAYSDAVITNCLVTDNSAANAGGIGALNCNPTITNCTVANNTATDYGGGINCNSSSPVLANTILWDNTAGSGGNQTYTVDAGSSVTLNYCDYANGVGDIGGPGTGIPNNCINLDPLFVSATSRDYHLQTISPCIDGGNNSLLPAGAVTDLDGNPRILNLTVEIGAYEFVRTEYLYVDGTTGDDANDGLSWATAVKTIRAGVNLTSGTTASHWTMTVADGTYTGTSNRDIDFGGKAIHLESVSGAASAIIDCESLGRAFYFHSGETSAAAIKGFTIRNGYITGASGNGGAIMCDNYSSPTIIDCIIIDNSIDNGSGAGIFCDNYSCPTITRCKIVNNSTASSGLGGGIACDHYSSPTITDCTIANNSAGYGGGINCQRNSSPTITNCSITNNSARQGGGGVRCSGNSNPTITNSTIANNSAGYGGGIYSQTCSPVLTNTLVLNNSASGNGGGFYCASSSPVLNNCNISGNSAQEGGSFWCSSSNPTAYSCTISANTADTEGGGFWCSGICMPRLFNTILWGNSASTGDEIYTDDANPTVILDYCDYADDSGDVEGLGTVTPSDCITLDPLFVSATSRDYHLRITSPCIDGGDNMLTPPSVAGDLDGNPRLLGGTIDIGAYEGGWLVVNQLSGPFTTIQSAVDGATDGYGVVVDDATYTGSGNKNIDFGGKAITLKSANGPANCIVDCENFGRGFYFHSGETPDSILDGFTIQNGYVVDTNGGGIWCYQSSPAIANCIVKNSSVGNGSGGGIGCDSNSNPTISNCTITGNSADLNGGGIYCWTNSNPTITSCTVANNSASSDGGGILCHTASSPTITNCAVFNNTAIYGAGIYCYDNSNPVITSCTIANNSATYGAGISAMSNDNPVLNNSILWGNTAIITGGEIYTDDTLSVVTLNYCDYDNGAGDVAGLGTVTPSNCININPMFVNPGSGDFHLQENSPCLDAGDNSLVPAGTTTDLDGLPRIFNGTVDIGVYEHRTWTQKLPTGKPSARDSHAMAYDSNRGVTVLFGGNESGQSCNDTWVWDGTNWTDMSPAGTEGVDYPSARYDHAMAYDLSRNVVVLFGGFAGSYSDETWEWDGTSWALKSPAARPAARYEHAMAYDSINNVVVLFGGYRPSGGDSDETWEWDGTNWTLKSPINKPSVRRRHAMAYDSSRGAVVLFGGLNGPDETWEWNGINWTNVSPGGTAGIDFPTGRGSHAMVYDSNRGVCVLFGGWSAYLDDTWYWDGATWTNVTPAGAAGLDYPTGRYQHAMAYDSIRAEAVLFGGYASSGKNNETWEY